MTDRKTKDPLTYVERECFSGEAVKKIDSLAAENAELRSRLEAPNQMIDDLAHYMEAVVRLRDENVKLRDRLDGARYFVPDNYERQNASWRTCECPSCINYRIATAYEEDRDAE